MYNLSSFFFAIPPGIWYIKPRVVCFFPSEFFALTFLHLCLPKGSRGPNSRADTRVVVIEICRIWMPPPSLFLSPSRRRTRNVGICIYYIRARGSVCNATWERACAKKRGHPRLAAPCGPEGFASCTLYALFVRSRSRNLNLEISFIRRREGWEPRIRFSSLSVRSKRRVCSVNIVIIVVVIIIINGVILTNRVYKTHLLK